MDLSDTTKNILIYGTISILIFLVVIMTLVSYKKGGNGSSDDASSNRIKAINRIMTELFGIRWPYTLLFIYVLLLTLLYLSNRSITSSDTTGTKTHNNSNMSLWLNRITVVFIIMFSLSILYLASERYLHGKNDGAEEDYINPARSKSLINMFTVLLMLFLIIIIIRRIVMGKNKGKEGG